MYTSDIPYAWRTRKKRLDKIQLAEFIWGRGAEKRFEIIDKPKHEDMSVKDKTRNGINNLERMDEILK
jgi:hypothetical protein